MKLLFDGNSFSKMIRQKRLIEENIDLRTLAKKINVSAATISRCENGFMPEVKSFARLCHYINKPMNDFITIKNGKK